ncbi:MAG: TRAP transporter small permease subunit [Aestuariivita sp.]|uniref:TRAP transporter small permease subunit n=1 Tax=Aestuariivita sp. TaxID=1872407 RepID=UPI003BAFE4CB
MASKDPFSRASIAIGDWMSPLFLVAVIITVYEVFMRYGFDAPTIWVHELTVLLSASCFVVSGLYVLAKGEHIRVTVLKDSLPAPFGRMVDLLSVVLGLIFLCAVAYGGAPSAWEALSNWHSTRTAFNSPTPAILKPMLAATSALMAVQLLVSLRHGTAKE